MLVKKSSSMIPVIFIIGFMFLPSALNVNPLIFLLGILVMFALAIKMKAHYWVSG